MPRRQNEAVWISSRERWQINVQRNGQRKTFTCGTPGRKGKIEAERKADKWLETMSNDTISFPEAWNLFIQDKRESTGSANFDKLDSIYRVWFEPHLKRKRLSMITCQDWQRIVNAAAKSGLSKRTCVNIRSAATTFYAFARKNRWEMEKPEYIDIPKSAPSGTRTILQPEDLKTLFSCDTISHYGKDQLCYYIYAYRLIVVLGLRRGEISGIMWDDIDGNILHIKRSINSLDEITRGKNENAVRDIYLPTIAIDLFNKQRSLMKQYDIESPYVFPCPDGSMPDANSIYKRWLTYRNQHGIKSSLHELRHTMISMMKADMPIELLKPVVGHSLAMDTFGTYGHEVDGDLIRAANIIDSVYASILQK